MHDRFDTNLYSNRSSLRVTYTTPPQDWIFRLSPRVSDEIIVTTTQRPRFVLLPLFRFLLLSVSQLVKAATASSVHLMTWRVETKGSFARWQVYTAEGLDETTFLLLFLPASPFSSSFVAPTLVPDITSHRFPARTGPRS